MIRIPLALALLFVLSAWDPANPHRTLQGTWTSKHFTVSIDWSQKRYTGTANGRPFDQDLELVKEQGNLVTLRTAGNRIIYQIRDDDTVLATKPPKGITVLLKRQR